jgi:diadenosine tetraphosphate (Ap4A) HIT family hydrolase
VPHRHVSDFFDLNNDELNDLSKVLKKQRQLLLTLDKKITGFNVGVNAGVDAGQSIMHCHIHLIPRRKSAMENPRGGVRGVIPSKQKYIK